MRTPHGHQIPGTNYEPPNESVFRARCGGIPMCTECGRYAELVLKESSKNLTQDEINSIFKGEVMEGTMNQESVLHHSGVNRSMPDSEIENRFGYHKGTEVTAPLHQAIRAKYIEMAKWLDEVLPHGRAKSVAFTELENAAMWSNKAIAEMAPVVNE